MDDEHHFGDGEPFTIGLEEELFLADPDSGRLINAGEEVLERIGELDRGAVKSELHRSMIELITGVCETVEEAVAELGELRRAVLATGVGVIAAGTHPTAIEGDSQFTDKPRYRQIHDWLGDAGVTPVCALHIHVGMPDARRRSASSTRCAATRRCSRRSAPTRPTATAATRAWPRRASSRCAPGRAPAYRGRWPTSTTSCARRPA
jgi:hypothetical protein